MRSLGPEEAKTESPPEDIPPLLNRQSSAESTQLFDPLMVPSNMQQTQSLNSSFAGGPQPQGRPRNFNEEQSLVSSQQDESNESFQLQVNAFFNQTNSLN